MPEACLEGNQCAAGHTGAACAQCQDRFFKTPYGCEACPESNPAWPMALVCLLCTIPLVFIYKKVGSGTLSFKWSLASIGVNCE